MTTLTLCFGMWFGLCGSLREFDYPIIEACERERVVQLKHIGAGYAVCSPKKELTK